jgi:hypothetical protein
MTHSRLALGPTHCILGDLSLGINQQEPEADQSPPPSSEEKNVWRYTCPPLTPSWLAQRQLYFRSARLLDDTQRRLVIR